MIKSKFAFGSTYLTLLFTILFWVPGIFFLTHPTFVRRAWIGGIFFTISGAFLLFFQLKRLIIFTIYPDRLELRSLFFRRILNRSAIVSVDLSGREGVGFSFGSQISGTIVITAGAGKKYVLLDTYYRNAPELKQALQSNFLSDDEAAPLFPEYVSGEELLPSGEEDEAENFAGNAIFSVNGITLLVVLGIFLMLPLSNHNRDGGDTFLLWGVPMIIFVLFYLAFGTQMYYFKLSDRYLIIRNQFFPWYRRGYRLDQIKEIDFEKPYKRSYALRVTTRDFSSKAFCAGSLRKDTWKALGKRLKKAGIFVKNEL